MRRKPIVHGSGSGSGTASAVDLNFQYSDCRKCRVKSPRQFGFSGLVGSPLSGRAPASVMAFQPATQVAVRLAKKLDVPASFADAYVELGRVD
jgi:hypothetical protein